MDISYLIFQILALIGAAMGYICGWYILSTSKHYLGDRLAKTNLRFLGVVDLFAAVVFTLAILQVGGFAVMSSFALFMRPLILLFILLPALIAYRMGAPKL